MAKGWGAIVEGGGAADDDDKVLGTEQCWPVWFTT